MVDPLQFRASLKLRAPEIDSNSVPGSNPRRKHGADQSGSRSAEGRHTLPL
jgi:hypothetical protein